MTGEFNLSKRMKAYTSVSGSIRFDFFKEEDVKEFIRLLKEEVKSNIAGSDKFYDDNPENLLDFIDKLAGDKLI